MFNVDLIVLSFVVVMTLGFIDRGDATTLFNHIKSFLNSESSSGERDALEESGAVLIRFPSSHT